MSETPLKPSKKSSDSTHTSAEKPKPRNKGARRKLVWLIVAVVICVAGVLGSMAFTGGEEMTSQASTAKVTRGPLLVSITEGGELEAERRKVIANELSWPVIIRETVEEGTLVKTGQTIIEFECKELKDAIEQQELQVTSAQNSHTQATQNLQLKKDEMDNNIRKAQRALTEAKENKLRYINHEYPIDYASKNSAVQLAKRELTLAKQKLEFKKRVNKMPNLKSPFSKNDIEAEKLKVQQLENSLKKSQLELQKLEKYDHNRKQRELDEKIEDQQLALRRTKLEAQRQILMSQADEQAKKRNLTMHKKRLTELREDEKKLTVKADKAGLVVYRTGRRHNSNIVIAKGEKINPRQQLMVIPDMSTLQIKTKVYEAMVSQVNPGLPAYIRLDIHPGESIKGKVKKVAVLPNSQNRWLNPDLKIFDVLVEFDAKVENLKPGMTAQVELILAELKNVISIPVAAVFTEKGKTFCYRMGPSGAEKVDIKIGQMNDKRVEVISGLAEGQEVLLAPPTDQAAGAASSGGPAT